MDKTQVLYATLPRRIKASIVDGVVLLALFILSPVIISTLAGKDTGLNAIAMFTPPLLLEPLLISLLGFKYIFGIQVIRLDSGEKCPLFASFARYLAKTFLGSLSIVYMLFIKKHQAIHDHLAKTLVVLSPSKIARNPEFSKHGEIEQDFENDATYTYPSVGRRFGFFCLWSVFVGIVVVIIVECAALLLLPGYTFESERMPKALEIALNLLQYIIFICLAVLASKGYLPGAKRKLKVLETQSPE